MTPTESPVLEAALTPPTSNPVACEAVAQPRPAFPYRRLFWKWHLYAGLFGAPLLILIAVTGGILVFSPEIDHALRPDLWKIEAPASPPTTSSSDESCYRTVRERYPNSKILQYRQSDRPDKPYQFLLLTPGIEGLHDVWINPYSGELVGERARETAFVRIVEQLHRRLLTGEVGSSIIELMTGWGIVLCLTGLFLWWPKTARQLRNSLTVPASGGAYKVNWRLHNALGGWFAVVILLLALTGMVFSTYTGAMYSKVMAATGGTRSPLFQPPKSTVVEGAAKASLDRMLEQVRMEAGPESRFHVLLPGQPDGSVVFNDLRQERPQWTRLGDFRIWAFDQYSGAVLQRSGWDDLHPMFRFRILSLVIHFGSIYGLPTKILAAAGCLAMVALAVSGVLISWWKRQRNAARAKGDAGSSTETSDSTAPVSRGLVAACVVVGLLFPTVGASYLVLAAWEWLASWYARRASRRLRAA